MIAGSLSSIVSSVLKRSPQASHSRRRRMVAPSSVTRESITRVSVVLAERAMHASVVQVGRTPGYSVAHCFSTFVAHAGDHRLVVSGASSTSQIQLASATQSGSP